MPPLPFEVVADEQAFRALEPEWRDLLQRVRRPRYFLSFDWVRRSWEHIARVRGQKLFVVVGRRDGKVVLIWPLARFRKRLLRTAEWIGGEHTYCHDALVEDVPEAGEWLEAAWNYVTKTLDFMWLSRMSDDAVLAPLIHRVKGVGRGFTEAPYVDWADWPDWEAYWLRRSKSIRKDVARRRRRFEEQGKVEFGFVTSPEEIGDTLEWMRVHKAAWMESRGLRTQDAGTDTAESMRDFYRRFATDTASASECLRLATLTLDGNVAAALLGFLFEGTFAAIIAAHDPALDKYAPGTLLLADLLRWTLENDCTIFDFMPYGEGYKYAWAPKEARITTYVIPCSLRGRVLVAWRRSRLGATVRRLVRLRLADIPRILRKRFAGPSPQVRTEAGVSGSADPAGRLHAVRANGGHYRKTRTELGRPQGLQPRRVYCWEYHREDSKLHPSCSRCAAYLARAARCWELARAGIAAGHALTFCSSTCEECDYHRLMRGQVARVLVLSEDPQLAASLHRQTQSSRLCVEVADSESALSALIHTFAPDFVVIDDRIESDRVDAVVKNLLKDPRARLEGIVLASDAAQVERGEYALDRIGRPFELEQLSECLSRIRAPNAN